MKEHVCKWALLYLVTAILALIATVVFIAQSTSFTSYKCSLHEDAYERLACLRDTIEEMVLDHSAKHTFSYIRSLQETGVISDCHVPLHWAGEIQLKKHDGEVGEALATCPIGCFEGCHHGVVEAYTAEYGTLEIGHVCGGITEPLLRRQCFHGLGHGLLRHDRTQVHRALTECDTLAREQDTNTCMGGVMMEYIDAQIYDNRNVFLENFTQTCDRFKKDESLYSRCLDNVGWGLMVATGHDNERGHELCEQFQNEKDIANCKYYVDLEIKQNEKERLRSNTLDDL